LIVLKFGGVRQINMFLKSLSNLILCVKKYAVNNEFIVFMSLKYFVAYF